MLRIGFDDETSQMDIKALEQHIVDLRNPSSITLGIRKHAGTAEELLSAEREREGAVERPLHVSSGRQPLRLKSKEAKRDKGGNILHDTSTLTRVKLLSEISQSPCCKEYRRLKLGSVIFQESAKGRQWMTTTLNLSYAVCPSYPAVVVVPTQVTEESLASIAGQFQHNRFPVVTWKHPKKEAVLLRSSSFVPSTIVKKKFTAVGVGAKLMPSVASKQQSREDSNLVFQNKAGVGVYNSDVEKYFYELFSTNTPSLDLVKQLSIPPPMMEFETELKRQSSYLPPASPAPSSDSTEFTDGENKKATAAAYNITIRTRVGSSVSQITRVKVQPEKDPVQKRKLSSRRKMFSSPQLPKRKKKEGNEDSASRHSSCSTASDISIQRESVREEELEAVNEATLPSKPIPRSANTSPILVSKKPTHKRTRSSDEVIEMNPEDVNLKDITVLEKTGSPEPPVSPIDWEALGNEKEDVGKESMGVGPSPYPSTSSTQEEDVVRNSSPELLEKDDLKPVWSHFTSQKRKAGVEKSPGSFSTLPTNPRDWLVMDALPGELSQWQASALYILGDKTVLQDIPEDLYPNCMFVPVEVPSPSEVSVSFKKLMRACIPSAPITTYLSGVQESGWVTQLTHLLQLGGAVADLMDIQGSSVLVCLESGWDATAQVVSIAQVLLDPYYRTMEGFKMLVEKDWLSFGHRFSHNGSLTSATNISTFTPIFLQFLDVVHQILRQFPLSFEFNDFFLRMLAYHHCSMRFHTFAADSEKERYANNWLPYRPRTANIYGSTGQTEFVSFWEHMETLHKDTLLFHNFKYQYQEETEVPPLRPYSYQANIDIWSFYLDNKLSEFPSYDTELISDGPLTLLDMHHDFFGKDRAAISSSGSLKVEAPGARAEHLTYSVTGEVSSLLLQYTKLMNQFAMRQGLPQVTWSELLDELISSSPTSPKSPFLFPTDKTLVSHGLTLHKRTTMAVLIKGKLAVELQTQFTTPHQFEPLEKWRAPLECSFCKHQINKQEEETLHKCKKCGCTCHSYCVSQMPYNCGQERQLRRRMSKRIKSADGPERSQPIFLHNMADIPSDGSSHVSEGYLYKRGKIVKNWKLRWFVLDTEKGELSYFDSNTDSKCHGTIFLKDILSVSQAEPQLVTSLKQGESGFFFNVFTQKRTYFLMALRAAERVEWMARIGAAIPH